MKVLLLGKTGQLGSYLEHDLGAAGYTLIAPGRNELDVMDIEAMSQFIERTEYNILINTTAFHQLDTCELEWEKAFLANSLAVKRMAQLAKLAKARFLTFSTDYVFDGLQQSEYQESDATNPLQVYGASKRVGENLAFSTNPDTIVIRTAGVYGGDGSRSKGGNIVLNLLKQTQEKPEIEVASNQISCSTYAKDLSAAIVTFLDKELVGGVYHLTNSGKHSWAEFAETLLQLVHSSSKIKKINRDFSLSNVNRPLNSALANSKAKNLGVILPSWQDALQRYINNEVNF